MNRPQIPPRARAAALAARLVARACRLSGRGGTALPGRVAERVDPSIVATLGRQLGRGSVLVTGTNGKTTTSAMLARILADAGYEPVHNSTGSNLMWGLATTLSENEARLSDRPERLVGVFEVDEAVVPVAAKAVRPRVIVFGNLFRDQLDRYAELDVVAARWRATISARPETIVVINADDPLVGELPDAGARRTISFGIDDPSAADDRPGQTADSVWCPACGAHLEFARVWFGHLGDYRCPGCGRARPEREVRATAIELLGLAGTQITVAVGNEEVSIHLGVPGLYNVYNALGAVAAARALGVPPRQAAATLNRFVAAFGRVERFILADRELVFFLVKNPTGYDQVLRTIIDEPGRHDCLLILNDRIADGRDVSWIWDVDFERLAGRTGTITVAGDRGAELALRLKYAGIEPVVHVPGSLDQALDSALATAAGRLYCLPTYTALLDLHRIVARRAGRPQYWQTATVTR